MRPASEIAAWTLAELDRLLEARPRRPSEAKAYRDVLMVALLNDCPVRMRNLTMIRIGEAEPVGQQAGAATGAPRPYLWHRLRGAPMIQAKPRRVPRPLPPPLPATPARP